MSFLDGFNTDHSTFILIACLVSFLLGLLLGYLIWGRLIGALRDELAKVKRERDAFKKELDELKGKYNTLDADYKQSTEQVNSLTLSNRNLENEKGQLHSDLYACKKEKEELIEDMEEAKAESGFYIDELSGKLKDNKGGIVAGGGIPETPKKEDKKLTKEEKAALSAKASEEVKAALGNKISAATEDQKDDLKKISGVGPFIEKKLNNLGIYTFEQVSQFDSGLVQTVTDAIQFFPGRIERDDWVGQAAKLHNLKLTNPDALNDDKKRPSNPEDLKIVEGIGPKIEQLLKDGGVKNWADLAGCSVDGLQAILDAAGDRYRIHNPSTWAKQAELARDGKWEELDKYQDFLIGGRDIADN